MELQQNCTDTYGRRLVLNKTIVYAAIATFVKVSSLDVVVVMNTSLMIRSIQRCFEYIVFVGFMKHVQLTVMFVHWVNVNRLLCRQ